MHALMERVMMEEDGVMRRMEERMGRALEGLGRGTVSVFMGLRWIVLGLPNLRGILLYMSS